ncbi:hypothetical protein [Metabacillus litoralis]|uniref:Uncharacterized protein n=1 Tax=Metabacillus litoralis TaxID=152268 RepID=A0A179SRD6_9BACI|nr:hypothetical protein [Metabacillus litoralis]OAS84051.1 hypothetical protein A6K24_08070 [Metabacillus litoralis]
MFNEYEFYLLSKLKKEEMLDSNLRKSNTSKQVFKSNVKAEAKTIPIDSTLCCENTLLLKGEDKQCGSRH